MRLATIEIEGRSEGAVIEADGSARPIGGTLQDLIAGGPAALAALRARLAGPAGTTAIPAGAVRLLAPLPRPEKNVFCVGPQLSPSTSPKARGRRTPRSR
jgi:hypothetical protein